MKTLTSALTVLLSIMLGSSVTLAQRVAVMTDTNGVLLTPSSSKFAASNGLLPAVNGTASNLNARGTFKGTLGGDGSGITNIQGSNIVGSIQRPWTTDQDANHRGLTNVLSITVDGAAKVGDTATANTAVLSPIFKGLANGSFAIGSSPTPRIDYHATNHVFNGNVGIGGVTGAGTNFSVTGKTYLSGITSAGNLDAAGYAVNAVQFNNKSSQFYIGTATTPAITYQGSNFVFQSQFNRYDAQGNTDPTPRAGSAFLYAKTDTSTKLYTMGDVGTIITISPHEYLGVPPQLMDHYFTPYITCERNVYLGWHRWINFSRAVYVQQKNTELGRQMFEILSTNGSLSQISNSIASWPVEQTVCVVDEDFDTYNTRMGYKPGDPGYLVMRDWNTDQQAIQDAYYASWVQATNAWATNCTYQQALYATQYTNALNAWQTANDAAQADYAASYTNAVTEWQSNRDSYCAQFGFQPNQYPIDPPTWNPPSQTDSPTWNPPADAPEPEWNPPPWYFAPEQLLNQGAGWPLTSQWNSFTCMSAACPP
jgi:hypothetical protein